MLPGTAPIAVLDELELTELVTTISGISAVGAAAILRHLHTVITTGQALDPHIAAHGTRHQIGDAVAA